MTDDSGNRIQAEGRDGADGKPGEDGNDGQDGKPGENGQDGQDGKPGEDGKDGITPQLKIEDGYWYVSYNDGASWTQLGKATGDKGEPGEPGQAGGIFKDVEETDDSVIFTLNDDSTITIPKATASETLDIVFGNTDSINVLPDKTYEIEYTITGADENTLIEVVAQDLYKASVSPTDYRSGKSSSQPRRRISEQAGCWSLYPKGRTPSCASSILSKASSSFRPTPWKSPQKEKRCKSR